MVDGSLSHEDGAWFERADFLTFGFFFGNNKGGFDVTIGSVRNQNNKIAIGKGK